MAKCIFRRVYTWWQTRSLRGEGKSKSSTQENKLLQRWESDYLLLPYTGLFEEYLEMSRFFET